MLGQSSGMGFPQSYQPHAFNEPTWSLSKYTTLTGQKVNVEGNVRAVFSMHRRQLAVWNDNVILICIDLHHSKTTIPTKDKYAIVKENNVSLCRLKFRSLADRVSFGTALADLVPVSNDKGASQEVSSQGWPSSSHVKTSSQSEFVSSQGRSESPGGSQLSQSGGYSWNGSSPANQFTAPFTPSSQPIIGTSGSQSWKMTPPSSQSTSQQFKNIMHPNEMRSHNTPELRTERSGWSTPLKRSAEQTTEPVKIKKEKQTCSNTWDASSSFSSIYSDSDSLNDSFSSCSSQRSEFSSQPITQSFTPTKADACTECTVERSDMATQTECPYPLEEEMSTLLKKLLDHPEFISFTNLLSAKIDENEELLAMVDKSFAVDAEGDDDDADKTQPLEEEDKEKADESGNESDQSDIIDL